MHLTTGEWRCEGTMYWFMHKANLMRAHSLMLRVKVCPPGVSSKGLSMRITPLKISWLPDHWNDPTYFGFAMIHPLLNTTEEQV